mgnify:CR=1 FL=1
MEQEWQNLQFLMKMQKVITISEESLPDDYKINDVNLVLKGICVKCKEK